MDFDTCYQLLAARPAHAHDHCVDEKNDHDAPDVQAVADAVASDLQFNQEPAQSPPNAADEELQDEELHGSVAQLGRAFYALQERRVQIYSEFQKGFLQFKATSQFEPFCALITSQFADVSKRVNAIEAALRQHQRVVLAQLIRKVQVQEKDKLMLTSALLVERMRLADMERRAEPDESTVALLQKSVQTMSATHTEILVQINELLDELRIELADEQDDEEE